MLLKYNKALPLKMQKPLSGKNRGLILNRLHYGGYNDRAKKYPTGNTAD